MVGQVRHLLASPEIIVRTWRAARAQDSAITENDVRAALIDLDSLWGELFPAEQARIIQLLVERVDLTLEGASIRLRIAGLTSLMRDLRQEKAEARRAA